MEQNATSEEEQTPSFTMREGVLYFQGRVREETVLKKGDNIQVWTNDLRRTGTDPKTGKPYVDPELYVKVWPKAQQESGNFVSRVISGLWSRVKRQN